MAPRKLAPLLVPLVLLGLMAVALMLVIGTGAFDDPGDGSTNALTAAELDDGTGDGAGGEAGSRAKGRSQRPGAIMGDVRSLDSRDAAPDRDVVLVLPDGTVRELTTDTAGGFTFGDVPVGGPYELKVEGHDHAPVLRPGLWLTPGQRLDVGTLWLADGVRVAVEVRSFDGRPLADAVVRAFTTGSGSAPFDSPRDPAPVAAARSGPDGWAHFEGLPPGTWTITAERAGYARRGLIGATVREGVDEETFRIALERGYRLHGRVLDGTGEPVRGAMVLAIRRTIVSDRTTAALAQRTMTDRDGRYSFAALPAADVVLWSGWPRRRLAVVAAVRVPGVEELDLTLLRGGKLKGRVTNRDDAEPVEGAKVDVNIQVLGSFALRFQALTNDRGEYTVDLPMPGTIDWVSVGAKGFVTQQPQLGDREQLLVPTGATVSVDVALAPGGVVSGRVTGPGGPVEGAEVAATNSSWYFTTTTDRQGKYTLSGLPDERFFVLTRKWGHTMPGLPGDPDSALNSGSAPAQFVVELGPGVDAVVDLTLEPGVSLRGRVERSDGTAASGALVEIPGSGTGTHTDEDGSFELSPVEPGDHVLVATLEGSGSRSQQVRIPPGGAAPESVTLKLPAGVRVTGRVFSKAGATLDGAYVQIAPWDGSLGQPIRDEWNWLETTRLPVDADGTFDHPLLQDGGTFFVRAGALGHRRASTGQMMITPGQESYYVELALEEGATFSGRVSNFDGAPVPGALVSVVRVPAGTAPTGVDYPGAWGPPISAVADEHGVFRVDGLDSGAHVFRAWAEGHIADAQTLSVPEDSGAQFEIIAWMSISGRVLHADGQPVVGVLVEATGGPNGDYSGTRTDDDGRFIVTGLARGDYAITVRVAPGGEGNLVRTTVQGVAAGSEDVAIEAARGQVIAGIVTDADGVPVAGAQIGVDDNFSAATEPDGSYELLGLAAGTYTVQVRSEAMNWVGEALRRGVKAGTTDVHFRLPRSEVLSGVLLDDRGEPLEARQLRMEPIADGGGATFQVYPRDVQAEQRGEFSVHVAEGARYRVTMPHDATWTLPRDTVVSAGSRIELHATRGATIAGRVMGPGGASGSGVQVHAQGHGIQRQTVAAKDGTFTISGLDAGEDYTVWINSNDWALEKTLEVSAPSVGTLLSVTRTLTMSGRIFEQDGSTVTSVAVRIEQEATGTSWHFWTNDEGHFSLGGLREGDCEVFVDRRGDGNEVRVGVIKPGTQDARLTLE